MTGLLKSVAGALAESLPSRYSGALFSDGLYPLATYSAVQGKFRD